MKDIKELITKYALQNAIKFKGKANPGNIIGKIIQEKSELKTKIKEISQEVQIIVKEVNQLSLDKQVKKLEKLAPELLEEKKSEKKTGLKELPNVKKKIIMRIAPSPSGPLHIGHSYILSLNYEYVKKYGGEFIVRIEDTNASNIYPKSYEMIPEDAKWLTQNNVDKIIIQSERINLYYDYALKLIEEEYAYVCECSQEEFKECSTGKTDCPCRNLNTEEATKRWHNMFTKYNEGEAVVRFKTDMQHNNPAMRDFPLFRINNDEHPKTGKEFRVWPLMNFSVAIDDMDLGITHALRGKDHADNAKKQAFIHKALGVPTPEAVSVGRINFTEGVEVSCSKVKPKVESGFYNGWDDIRLPFMKALKRRGFQAEALRRYAKEVGISKNDKSVTMKEFFKTINAFNKDIIDPTSYRYFFIENPVLIKIEGTPEKKIEMDLQPDNKKGGRKFKTKDEFYITKIDLETINDNKLCRLIDCINFVKDKKKLIYQDTGYKEYKEKGDKIMHWLPKSDYLVDVEILMPDNTIRKGLGEETMKKIKQGDIVQLERFGFCRLDQKEDDKLTFWFTHK